MTLKCIAIDDDQLALAVVKKYAKSSKHLQLLDSFTDAETGFDYLCKNKIDLLFLDVDMPGINGVELASALIDSPMIIFITAHKGYAFESYEVDAIDFLLKPINLDRFNKSVLKAVDFKNLKTPSLTKTPVEDIYVKSGYQSVKIALREIEYIESAGDYLKIFTTNKQQYISTLMTMKKLLEKLPPDQFARVHKGFIISLSKVISINHKKVQLTNMELPIGAAYKDFYNNKKTMM